MSLCQKFTKFLHEPAVCFQIFLFYFFSKFSKFWGIFDAEDIITLLFGNLQQVMKFCPELLVVNSCEFWHIFSAGFFELLFVYEVMCIFMNGSINQHILRFKIFVMQKNFTGFGFVQTVYRFAGFSCKSYRKV